MAETHGQPRVELLGEPFGKESTHSDYQWWFIEH
jgi:hypothetical protein